MTNAAIGYGEVVRDTITNDSIYDLWAFYGVKDDQVRIEMVAADGLAPLIGVLDSSRSLMIRSDELPDRTRIDAPVNGVAVLEFTVPDDGEYVISATRVGNAEGTTTGSYTLSLTLLSGEPESDYQDVSFLCGQDEVTTAATFEFHPDLDVDENYRVTVFGLDGFEAVLRAEQPASQDTMTCTGQTEASQTGRYQLPGEEAVEGVVTQMLLSNPREAVQLTVGSRDGQAGRYLMVIEGFSVNPPGDQDTINARLGPFARESEMTVYMVRTANTRLDPTVWLTNPATEEETMCDDAGRRGCEAVNTTNGFMVELNDGVLIEGQRFDAGVKIATGNPEPVRVTFGSRSTSTTGGYYILIMGELPAR